MDFSKVNIPEILKYSMPERFQDMSPTDFEDFIAQLFKELGYSVEQTSYSGDFGADLLITKSRVKTVVQVKRYASSNKVGVKDINQVIGAKDYYDCKNALIVTTSDYTAPGKKLLNKSNVENWNWNKLQNEISKAYLNNKDIYEYYPTENSHQKSMNLSFSVTKVEYEQPMNKIGNCTLLFATIKNNGSNVHVSLDLPIYISKNNKQIEAAFWYESYFSSGTIYASSKVELAFMFRSDQLKKVITGDRIIFSLYGDNMEKETFDTKISLDSFNSCYITTMCYGKDSNEYLELTYFRDNFLVNYKWGRDFINFYYKNSGVLIVTLQNLLLAKAISKAIIKVTTFFIAKFNSTLRNKALQCNKPRQD